MTLNFPGMILLETSLSFLGVGVQPPMSSLGTMLGFGRDYLTSAWWIAVIPGVVIVLATLSMSILGDYVQQKLESRCVRSRSSCPGAASGARDLRASLRRKQTIGARNPFAPDVVPSVNPGRTSGAEGFSKYSPAPHRTLFIRRLCGRSPALPIFP